MRAMGLDVGSKTIGVAISDELGVAAHPRVTLPRQGTDPDVSALTAMIAEAEVTEVVVGIPYELSGREGPRAKRVRVLVDALRAALPAGVTMHEQDERFTTAEAQRILIAADLSRQRRKQVIDQQAAVLILQGWLDGRRRAM
ncbi:MAG: Holliday junction resolvase RuvX [Kofleriaceae bacterium]|nr:Holliday junction resolvase RuvX [Myxococcales bacterium]MCB9558825.1 Holliday junction resolvase RuvX [Kofleriaceae bacterium]MCB9570620.1 Holliday junction resolvase RuvX [Kofleriaceae bacterium]